MKRRFAILKHTRDRLFNRLKTRLATDKELDQFRELQNRMERVEKKIKEKELRKINQRYRENINAIINGTAKPNTRAITIDFK